MVVVVAAAAVVEVVVMVVVAGVAVVVPGMLLSNPCVEGATSGVVELAGIEAQRETSRVQVCSETSGDAGTRVLGPQVPGRARNYDCCYLLVSWL